MDLEMLDGFLAAIVSGPESIQPSEWLPQVWSDGGRSATPAYGNSEQAQQIMTLILRHMVGIQRTLAESPTRFRPLLYLPEEKKPSQKPAERQPPEGTAWCEGFMAGVKLRDDEWQPLYDAEDARDWVFSDRSARVRRAGPRVRRVDRRPRKSARASSRNSRSRRCSSFASGRTVARPRPPAAAARAAR
jgi:yecA family protein